MFNFSSQPRVIVPTDHLEPYQKVAHSLKRRLRQSVSVQLLPIQLRCLCCCCCCFCLRTSGKKPNSALLSQLPSLLLQRSCVGGEACFSLSLFRVTWCDPAAFLDEHRPTHRLSPLSGVTGQPVFSCRTLAWVKRQTVGGRHGVRRVALIFEQLVGAH